MTERPDITRMYRTRNEGGFPDAIELIGRSYTKVEDLRYGTNPHQPAALYRPKDGAGLVVGAYRLLKSGKGGLCQINVEDMHHAVGILAAFAFFASSWAEARRDAGAAAHGVSAAAPE